jgi:hypothetical protein
VTLRRKQTEVVYDTRRSYRVTVERYVYVSAFSRDDAKSVVARRVTRGEMVTGAVEDLW